MAKKVMGADGKEYKVKKPFYKRVWFWILVIIVLVVIGGGLNNKGKTSSESTEKTAVSKTDKTSASTASSSEPEDKVYKVGEVASYKGYEIKVNNVKFDQGDDINTPDSGKQYVIANITITNNTDKSQDYNPFFFKLNADGNKTDFSEITTNVEDTLHSGSLDKGATVTGNLVGQAKTDAKSLQLQYQPSFWNDKSIKIDLK